MARDPILTLQGVTAGPALVRMQETVLAILRAAGFENAWTPYANLIHHESATRGHQRTDEEQAQFFREADYMQKKWGEELLHDPFYNPNLALTLPGYELSFPPRDRAEA
jgi:hypothetical protein